MKTLMKISVLSIIMVLAAACAPAAVNPATGAAQDAGQANSGEAQVLQGSVTIEMKGFAFSPKSVTVKTGTQVTWINQDPAGHDVVAGDNSFKSGTLEQGQSFTYQFNQAGTFAYSCTFHRSMEGVVTVVP